MNSYRLRNRLYLLLALVALFSPKPSACAQTVAGDPRPNEQKEKKGAISPEAVESKDDIEQLKSKIDQLVLLVERQQRAMAEMEKRLNSVEAKPQTAMLSPASLKLGETAAAAQPADTRITSTDSAPSQAPPLETRFQKVEEQLLKLGPIRLSGDFRLRYDAILRRSTVAPDPALAHVQNTRMRYRLRLNMDTDINPVLSFHGQLSTGPINNALTQDQDFSSTVAHQPFFISEAWIDYHPNKSVQLQGGRVQEVFADNSRFLFDDDVRFNGFNERFSFGKGSTSIELRAGQYWFSNPNVAVITAGSPLATAGAEVGTIGRSANLFHQGLLWNQKSGERWSQQFGADVQVFREPNQIQLASTAAGVAFIVQPGLGLVLSGPMTGTGNATTTSGGAIYTAEDFHVGRLTYRLNHTGFRVGEHAYPIAFNLQGSRNFGTDANERDAMLAALQVGRLTKRGDMSFMYVFSIKGANSIISQLTDDDLGTTTGVNLRTHYFRWELGLARKVTLQSLVFVQRELRSSGQFPNFFVPLNAFTPRQYRFQEHLVFSF
ncbi:MAG TPA: putative porin [Blastocatellia bacterium]|nr:putative porin [Blastocatellia bacterium]